MAERVAGFVKLRRSSGAGWDGQPLPIVFAALTFAHRALCALLIAAPAAEDMRRFLPRLPKLTLFFPPKILKLNEIGGSMFGICRTRSAASQNGI